MSQPAALSNASSGKFRPSSVLLDLLPPKVHGEKVNYYFDKLPESIREEITKDDLAQYLDSRNPEVTEERFLDAINTGTVHAGLLKDHVCDRAQMKLSDIYTLTSISPRDIDVLIAQSLNAEVYTLPRALDPSSYATYGMQQSYETLTTNALFSTRSIISQLQGDSVHFMMFAKGQTQIECKRFSFGENPVFSPSSSRVLEGDPCRIDESLCTVLKIADDEDLTGHALRLEMIQQILRPGKFAELDVQALFSHWLGKLVRQLDGDNGDLRVTDVIGMSPVVVMVEVCNEYLAEQGKIENSNGSGVPAQLSVKSDIAVCRKALQSNATDAFLYSSYHVEMKQALKLKYSAMDCKSQLVAESLARSILLLNKDKQLPEVLYSILCDGLCLHVLVHFPKKNVAYLSHREIEPGRITCVVTWLHKLSARSDLSEEEFLDMGFSVGESLESEVNEAVKRKRESTPGKCGGKTEGKLKKSIAPTRKRMCIDVVADEERVRQEEEQNRFASFSRIQNHCRYGDPLPLTEVILSDVDGSHEPLSTKEKLLRAGLVE